MFDSLVRVSRRVKNHLVNAQNMLLRLSSQAFKNERNLRLEFETFTRDYDANETRAHRVKNIKSKSTPAIGGETRLSTSARLHTKSGTPNAASENLPQRRKGQLWLTTISRQRNWFHSLPSQRFQALLTLFPKSFSSFPHGTCLLSVSLENI